jgi:hypothetical protein
MSACRGKWNQIVVKDRNLCEHLSTEVVTILKKTRPYTQNRGNFLFLADFVPSLEWTRYGPEDPRSRESNPSSSASKGPELR